MGLSSTLLGTVLCADQRAAHVTSSWGLSTAHFCTKDFVVCLFNPALGHCCRKPEN